jgi:hypothetical protein
LSSQRVSVGTFSIQIRAFNPTYGGGDQRVASCKFSAPAYL